MHIKWQAPEVMSGRFTRYELLCNGRCIYSGVDQEYHATMLKSDTEYTMVVIVFTNEGRFRSRPAKARTLKDECLYLIEFVFLMRQKKIMLVCLDNNSHRPPLYESAIQSSPKVKRIETGHVVNSTGTNNSTSKLSPQNERRLFRERKDFRSH